MSIKFGCKGEYNDHLANKQIMRWPKMSLLKNILNTASDSHAYFTKKIVRKTMSESQNLNLNTLKVSHFYAFVYKMCSSSTVPCNDVQ